MKVLIVEDEMIAADRLQNLLLEIEPKTEVLDQLDSVKSVVRWFEKNGEPDLMFLDIQLADGLSFEIFEQTKVECPIIFTTAYDQYAIKAFKVNSVDYLLKPMQKSDLETALEKFNSQNTKSNTPTFDPDVLAGLLQGNTRKYKERFVIKIGEHLKTVKASETEVFFSQDKSSYLVSNDGRKLIVDYTMDQLEDIIDPDQFFRISRKYIVKADSIKDIISFSNSRLKLELHHFTSDDMIVSRERVSAFKAWLDR